MDERERRLEAEIDDLAETLEELRAELDEPSRGPLGLPRPPTPGEFLRLTERYAIPATISLLETSIRTLELLAATIRVADGRPLDGDPTDRRRGDTPRTDRIATAGRRTLAKLDDALADLQSAAAGGDPANPELQRLLAEARELRAEVDDRLAEATGTDPADSDPDPVDIEVERGDGTGDQPDDGDGSDGGDDDDEDVSVDDVRGSDAGHPGVDVESELESIKREFDDGADDEANPTSGDDDRDDGGSEPNGDDGAAADSDAGGDGDSGNSGAR